MKETLRSIRLTGEACTASPIVSHGRIYVTTMDNMYCIGTADRKPEAGPALEWPQETPGDQTVAQVQVLIRAPDPLMEIALRLGGHKQEDIFWQQTLGNLARYFGVAAKPETRLVCLDRRVVWRKAGNMRYNPMFKMVAYTLGAPLRMIEKHKATREHARG